MRALFASAVVVLASLLFFAAPASAATPAARHCADVAWHVASAQPSRIQVEVIRGTTCRVARRVAYRCGREKRVAPWRADQANFKTFRAIFRAGSKAIAIRGIGGVPPCIASAFAA